MTAAPGHDLATRRLYLCTPDRPDLARFIADCIAGGVDVVQLRDKELEARQVLARAAGHIVAVRQGGALATAFHPEMTGDRRIHQLFVDIVRGRI